MTLLVLGVGIPELRHDWRIPPQPDAVTPFIASLFEPWLSSGIGNAQPYPTFYWVGFMLWPFRFLGSFGVTVLIVFATVLLAARAAAMLVRRLGGDRWTAVAAATFAVLNPWVYSKYVAGHLLMIFAYAVWIALLAEVARTRPRRPVLIALVALSVTQIEFFAIGVVPLVVWLVRRRAYRVLAALTVAAAPIIYGIVATYSQIRGTPFNLSWQETQSLNPGQALLLNGYAFDYAQAFSRVWIVTLVFFLVALSGIIPIVRDGRYAAVVAVASASYVLATGTKGPIAPLYRWAVSHFPEIGLFRELYDLVALVAIGYIVLIARGAGRHRFVGIALSLIGAAYLVPWLVVPPDSFFVSARLLPQAQVPGDSNQRVAMLPAFQPLTFNGRGSGVDPDGYVRDEHAIPLNEFFPTYPVDAALGYANFENDDRYIAALGVSELIVRPYLQSNLEALKYQWIGTQSVRLRRRGSHHVDGLPLLALTDTPAVVSIGNRPDESSLFFGDLEPGRIRMFEPSRASGDPHAGWIDARLAVPLHPDWGTSFGGVLTQSAQDLPLAMPAASTSLLAHADGTLVDDSGRIVASKSTGLHWWRLSPSARAVRCRGTCIVVLQGAVPLDLPEHRPLLYARALAVTFLMPWLARADIPAHSAGMLRLNVRYDRAWTAFSGSRQLRHVRLDTALNGWSISGDTPTQIFFVQRTAAVQVLLEFAAAGVILVLLALEALGRYRLFDRNSANEGAS